MEDVQGSILGINCVFLFLVEKKIRKFCPLTNRSSDIFVFKLIGIKMITNIIIKIIKTLSCCELKCDSAILSLSIERDKPIH